jgi:hypothetical protein
MISEVLQHNLWKGPAVGSTNQNKVTSFQVPTIADKISLFNPVVGNDFADEAGILNPHSSTPCHPRRHSQTMLSIPSKYCW